MGKREYLYCPLIFCTIMLILAGCDGILPMGKWLSLNKDSSILLLNETDQLEAMLAPNNERVTDLIWITSDPITATVSNTGLVQANVAGTAKITACNQTTGLEASCQITVIPVAHVTGVKIEPSFTVSLSAGQTFQFSATVTPSNVINDHIIWSSNHPEIATISITGMVTAITDGTTTVSATTEDGGFHAFTMLQVISTSIPVTGITLEGSGDEEGIVCGSLTPIQLNCTVLPSNATNKNVFWVSSNPRIATVSQDGLVTPSQFGEVNIIVFSEDGGISRGTHISFCDYLYPGTP
jgi:alpha-amylase